MIRSEERIRRRRGASDLIGGSLMILGGSNRGLVILSLKGALGMTCPVLVGLYDLIVRLVK